MSTYDVAVVGLGKIGLPLACTIAHAGNRVVGIDVDEEVVTAVSAGRPHFPNEDGLAELLDEVVRSGALIATADASLGVSTAEVVIVVVPLVVDQEKEPDFAALDAATASIAAALTPDTLVVYETTLPVGTTRDRFAPALAGPSGLGLGEELFVAFSPERISSGRALADFRRYPKLVGGIDPESTRRAAAFYSSAFTFDPRPELDRGNGVWDLETSEAAEFAKLAETTYRDVNIALANEFALHAQSLGVDFDLVRDACNSQPFSHIHRAGVSVGGHCIPVYPHLYLAGDPEARLPAVSRRVNDAMPGRVVDMLDELAGGLTGQDVLVLGATYRGGVKELAFSGVFDLVRALRGRGARPVVSDPLLKDEEIASAGLMPVRGVEPVAAVVHTDHAEYRTLAGLELPSVRFVVDGRRILDTQLWPDAEVLSLGAGRVG